MNNDTAYKSNAISTDILSVLDVTTDGKVVHADDWNQLWTAVFNSINSIDAYCITVNTLLLNYRISHLEMLARFEAMRIKYDALADGFVHYGEEPPTNEHIQFWVKPVGGPGGPDSTVLATMADLAKKVTKFDRVDLSANKWSQSAPYSQSVSLSNITANSKIDLTPTPTQLNEFYIKGHLFIVENKNKIVTVYCIGQKPTVNYTIPATITEVTT